MAYYAPAPADGPGQADARLTALLERHGWTAQGTERLAGYPAHRFLVPGCMGPVTVAVLPPGGEATGLFEHQAALRTRRLAFIGTGSVPDRPPMAYVADRLSPVLALVGIGRGGARPALAVIEPLGCDVEHQPLWQKRPGLRDGAS